MPATVFFSKADQIVPARLEKARPVGLRSDAAQRRAPVTKTDIESVSSAATDEIALQLKTTF